LQKNTETVEPVVFQPPRKKSEIDQKLISIGKHLKKQYQKNPRKQARGDRVASRASKASGSSDDRSAPSNRRNAQQFSHTFRPSDVSASRQPAPSQTRDTRGRGRWWGGDRQNQNRWNLFCEGRFEKYQQLEYFVENFAGYPSILARRL